METSENVNRERLNSSDGKSFVFTKTICQPDIDYNKPVKHVFIVHGLVEHHGRHQRLADYFFHQDQTILDKNQWVFHWLDLVGHGLSGGARAHIDDFATFSRDLAKFINNSIEKNPMHKHDIILVAHSMGGLVALDLMLNQSHLLQYSVNALVLSNPCVRVKMELGGSADDAFKKIGSYLKKIRIPTIYKGHHLTHDEKIAREFDTDPLVSPFTTTGLLVEMLKKSKEIRPLAYYLNLPVLFLVSGQDELVDSETTTLFAGGVAGDFVSIIHYPELRHELFNEVPREKVFSDVFKWLGRILKNH